MSIYLKSLALLLIMISTYSYGCSAYVASSPNETIKFNPTITVQRDTPVGSVITSAKGTLTGDPHYFLSKDCSVYVVMLYNGAQASGVDNVYKTNVPGVGIRIRINSWNHGGAYAAPSPGGFVFTASSDTGGFGFSEANAELIKTENITSGVLLTGEAVKYEAADNENTDANSHVTWSIVSSSTINQVACSIVSGESLAFPIGDVMAGQFIAPGTVSKEARTVNLGLDCDAGANVNITLNGVQSNETSDSSVLSLTTDGGQEGIAEGVGVQLLYNNEPLKLNSRIVLKQSQGGQESFPITARYIQTKDKVKPGIANATAVLNLTYQ
ncbi:MULTISPECIES: fimbrial protein [Enterobacter]|jgi:type 1 fimbria pilin|uniref:fimbrial protein n=1 Tax=Enterobacter TaxID=547 RepID=UPI0009429CC1|nr:MULTISPECIES: fimbrial protein [Enterobacter]MCK6990107.1 fimbrial protein [Enterobacter asburiae]MCS3488090.1 type 1 fimbria pilin [Enterobacter sp. SLBN-59]